MKPKTYNKAHNQAFNKLLSVPKLPGVYILKGPKEKVLYVGKAKNLRVRLSSYWKKGSQALDIRKASMMRRVKDFSFIATKNELEALILESNLIKQYKPCFNIILRDDKNYPYLKITVNEDWPTIEVVRKIKKDGSLYFGPYVPSGTMWEALTFIRRNFRIRPCRYKLDKPMRPCIQYEMGRCPAPCAGYIKRNDYMKAVTEAVLFLKGQRKELLEGLQGKMQHLSDEMRFEDAAEIRDRINALNKAWESQKVISPELGDIDVIGHHIEGRSAVFQVFFIRNGIMIGVKDFYLKDVQDMTVKGLYHSFIEMFYAKDIIPSPQIITGIKPEAVETLKKWLKEMRGSQVKIVIPKEGKMLELLQMAQENARLALKGKSAGNEALEELKIRFALLSSPYTIGAFDVSTISGSESAGAFICWQDGEFNKDMYRHLKIKTVSGIDDCAMMEETVRRVLKDMEMPDLIVVDGGRGQLEAARKAMASISLPEDARHPVLIAIAKKPDRAFTMAGDIVSLEDKSPSSLLLKKIRDEAHRFAIGFHKKLRSKRLMESSLEKIKGIGKKRRLSLLRHFGSIDAIRKANAEELMKVPHMNRKAANLLEDAKSKGLL